MSASTINVSGISSKTNEKEVRDFFSFCGKISNISMKDGSSGSKTAEVTFEKNSAAKTALLLDSTQLGDSQVHVTSASGVDPMSGKHDHDEHDDVAQEDKPRSRIMAEYLAHGYRLGDSVIQRGLDFDAQHGISSRFTQTLQNFDAKYDASGKTKQVDEKYQVSDRAAAAFGGLTSYFEQALQTPTGQKLRSFYEQGTRQVADVHSEALHLAGLSGKSYTSGSSSDDKSLAEKMDMHKIDGGSRTQCNCGSNTEKCPCAPGTCACGSCAKNPDASQNLGHTKSSLAEEMDMHKVDGGNRTQCNCGSNTEKCPCAPGTCACSSCAKNPDASKNSQSSGSSSLAKEMDMHKVDGGSRTECKCGANTEKCPCAPGTCACSSCAKNPDTKATST